MQENFWKIYITVDSEHNTATMKLWTQLCLYIWTILKFLQNNHITQCQFFPRNKVKMITSLFNGLAQTECLVVFSITRHHTKGLLCSWAFVRDKALQAGLPETVNGLKDKIAEVTAAFPRDVLRHVWKEKEYGEESWPINPCVPQCHVLVIITGTTNYIVQEEIKSRLKPENACYHTEQNLLSSSSISKNIKIKTDITIILPFVFHGCETWLLTMREGGRLRMFENRVLRWIFGPKRDKIMGKWRKLHNEELNDL